jgi:hypothetical protein
MSNRLEMKLARVERFIAEQSAAATAQATQVALRLKYLELRGSGSALPSLSDVEFRCYSQNGEDGILLYLFSLLGTEHRRSVEICAGSGLECNTANLIINHGWHGLLVDGDAAQIARGKAFYAQCPTTRISPPTLASSWITVENVGALLAEHRFGWDIDLLSLDLDGNDYWIWQALPDLRPRVVVLEFNALLGPHESLSLPYDPKFQLDLSKPPYKCGASLTAFTRLAASRGYRLVGLHSLGFNAFFVRDDLAPAGLPALTPETCFAETERLRGWSQSWSDMMVEGGQRWETV